MIFKMNQVIKRYKDRLALDLLTIEGKEGQVVGLLGPNGAGKTTAIKALTGLILINGGTIDVFGLNQDTKNNVIKSQIGYVTQEITLYEDMTARDNLKFFASLYKVDKTVLNERIEEVAKIIGLTGRLDERVASFSGGMKRRLNIGCSIVHQPKLLIMDEPTVGVDPQSRNYILEFVKAVAKKGTTVIYTSHYIEEVQAIADVIYIMDLGHVIASGTLTELISRIKGDSHLLVETKNPSENIVDELRSIKDVKEVYLDKNKYHIIYPVGLNIIETVTIKLAPFGIMNIESKQPNLEDVFLTLTGKQLRDGDQ